MVCAYDMYHPYSRMCSIKIKITKEKLKSSMRSSHMKSFILLHFNIDESKLELDVSKKFFLF